MGLRQASGTKPTQLRNPVPTVDQEAFNQEQLNQVPDSQMRSPAGGQQMAQPTPSPTPAPDQSPMGQQSQAPMLDFSGISDDQMDFSGVSDVAQEEPINYIQKYANEKTVETSFLGMTLKRDEDGNVLVKKPFGKTFKEPDEETKDFLRLAYQSYLDLPTIAGGVAGSAMVGGMYGMAGGPPGALAGMAAGALAGAAGSGLGAAASESRFKDIVNDPERAKDFYIMSELFKGEELSPTGVVPSMLMGAAGEVAGAGIQSAKAAMRSVKDVAKQTLETVNPILAKAIDEAKQAGVDIDAADVLRMMSPAAGEKYSMIEAGAFGEQLQKEALSRSRTKQIQLKAALTSLLKKHGGDINFADPSSLGLSSRFAPSKQGGPFANQVMEPKKNLNVLQVLEENMAHDVGMDRAAMQEIAGDFKVDANQLLTSFSDIVSKTIPGAKDFISNGKINKAGLLNHVKSYIPVEGAEKLAKALNLLDAITAVSEGGLDTVGRYRTGAALEGSATQLYPNTSERAFQETFQSEFFPGEYSASPISKELGPTTIRETIKEGTNVPGLTVTDQSGVISSPTMQSQPSLALEKAVPQAERNLGPNIAGDRRTGMNFKTLTAFTDLIQGMVKDSEGSAIEGAAKELSVAARQFEDDAIMNIANMRGNKALGERVLQRKAKYANAIEDIVNFQKYIKNNDSLAGQFLKMNGEEASRFSALLTPVQKQELKGIILDRAMRDSIDDLLDVGSVIKVNPQKLAKNLVKDPQARSNLTMLYGADDVKKIDAIIGIADLLDRQSLSTKIPTGLVDKAAKYVSSIGVENSKDWLGALLMGNPRAKEMILARANEMSRLINKGNKGIVSKISKLPPRGVAAGIKSIPTYVNGRRNNEE